MVLNNNKIPTCRYLKYISTSAMVLIKLKSNIKIQQNQKSQIMKKVLYILMTFASPLLTHAQNIFPSSGSAGIGTTAPHASSILEMKSTTKGLLIPRMTKAQRDAIVSPASGLMIYQTNSAPGFYYYDGSGWQPVSKRDGRLQETAAQILPISWAQRISSRFCLKWTTINPGLLTIIYHLVIQRLATKHSIPIPHFIILLLATRPWWVIIPGKIIPQRISIPSHKYHRLFKRGKWHLCAVFESRWTF